MLLFSSEFIYDDMEFVAVAEVSFCVPTNDFTFRWQISDMNISDVEDISGDSLRLPQGVLQAGKLVEVSVAVLNKESLPIAKATLPVKILAKDFEVQITPSECSVGMNQEIQFQALISRHPNVEVESIKWTCSRNGTDCSEILTNSSGLSQQVVFLADGIFELRSEISINGVQKSSVSKVQVNSQVIPHVQIKYFPVQPINVKQSNLIVVTILNLIPKCIAYWNVVFGDGFPELRSNAEGNFTNIGFTFIKDFKEYFLQELVDYDNNTISKDVTLSLPSEVLKTNVKYKFRLTTICPKPVNDVAPEESTLNVSSYFDIILSTNGAPETFPLLVQPSMGIPMKTSFKFTTGVAKDSPTDFPLKYTFGYIVEGFTVNIGTFYESTVAHSQLPFADSIETFCDVCDNNGACSKISGQTVSAAISHNFTKADYEFMLEEFAANLKRAEYNEAINTAVVLLLTKRKLKEDSSLFESKMVSMMKTRLDKLKISSNSGFAYQQNIADFVKMSKALMNLMAISDEAFVTELLSLTETIARSARKMKRATFPQSSGIVNYHMDYIRNVLGLSEILLSSSNTSVAEAEKEKFVAKIYKFIPSICNNKNLDHQTIESKFVQLEVLKVYSPQLSVDSQKFPGGENDAATILLQQNGIYQAKYVCVAKIKFTIDIFQVNSKDSLPVYEAIILDQSDTGSYKEVAVSQFSDLILVNMSAASSDSSCFMMTINGWSSDDCTNQKSNSTTRIACKCKTRSMERIIVK